MVCVFPYIPSPRYFMNEKKSSVKVQRKKICRKEAFKRLSSLVSSKAYQRRILWSLTCSCNVDTKAASDQHIYWAVIFFRIYFTTSIKSNLTSKNFICCTYNVAALLQNSKNFAICSWDAATTSQNGFTTLQPNGNYFAT